MFREQRPTEEENLKEALYAVNRALDQTSWDNSLREIRDEIWRFGQDRFGWQD